MPISEDEYDHRTTYEPTSTMSKAELRKTHKPIMEKRRRARINHCLNEIKTLILDAMKKDPARHSKLEKADILEMAVKHLQNVQRQQLALAMATDPSVLRKFKAGFNECADEVNRYIRNLDGLDSNIQQRISQHLSKCISGIEQIVHLNFPGYGGVPFLANTTSLFSTTTENSTEASGDQNNNPSIQIPSNLQLIPSRLPTGELALLLPNSNNLPYFSSVVSPKQINTSINQEPNNKSSRPSAFVTVIPSSFNNLTITPKSPAKSTTRNLSPPQSPSSSNIRLEEDCAPNINQSTTRRTPSPHGFRPVNPLQRAQISSFYQQGASQSTVSSTSKSSELLAQQSPQLINQTEVKSIKFPIQKYASPQKLAEPLSIITNHSERYKQAQVLEETANFEENIQRGVKRKSDINQTGLLAVASPSKIVKTFHEPAVDFKFNSINSINKVPEIVQNDPQNFLFRVQTDESGLKFERADQNPSTSRKESDSDATGDAMWRPW